MSAVAISPKDMSVLQSLQKKLKMRSKAQVIHCALEKLQLLVERERLALLITESVQKCARADLKENNILTGGASFNLEDDS